MRIRILRNLGQGLPSYKEGECHDADDKLAERLLGMGLAEPVSFEVAEALPQMPDKPARKTRKQAPTEPPTEA